MMKGFARSVFGAGLISLVAAACLPEHPLPRPAGCGDEAAGSWTVVATSTHPLPAQMSLHAFSAAVLDGTAYFAGRLSPSPEVEDWVQHPPVVGRLDTGLIEPPFPRWAVGPRVVAAGDRLVLLWGEPADTAGLAPAGMGVPPESIWYSVMSQSGDWSWPLELIRDTAGISWIHTYGAVVGTPDGEIHLAFRNTLQTPSSIYYAVISPAGTTRVTEIPLPMASSYTAILVTGDSVLLATSATLFSGSPFPTLHLLRSADGGRSWSEPTRVREVDEPMVSAVNLSRTTDGLLHLLAGIPEQPGSAWMDSFQHFTSGDNGRTWQAVHTFSVSHPQSPHLVPDACGGLHFTVSDLGPEQARVLHSRWDRGRWTASEAVFSDRGAGYHVLLSSTHGADLVFPHGVTSGSTTLTWARNRAP